MRLPVRPQIVALKGALEQQQQQASGAEGEVSRLQVKLQELEDAQSKVLKELEQNDTVVYYSMVWYRMV